MPQDPEQRERRLETIRELLSRFSLGKQRELVLELRGRGFPVTQSSVSRDLRELGVTKVRGVYSLPGPSAEKRASGGVTEAEAAAEGLLLRVVPAGAHLLVLHTVLGGASRLALAIDQAGWPEVAGTVAGDDTLFVAIVGVRDRRKVEKRLQRFKKGA